jgi:hypothetical protein
MLDPIRKSRLIMSNEEEGDHRMDLNDEEKFLASPQPYMVERVACPV